MPRLFGVLAEGNFQDPHNARLLYLASGGLLLLGLAFSAAVWGVAILGALRVVGWIAAGRHG